MEALQVLLGGARFRIICDGRIRFRTAMARQPRVCVPGYPHHIVQRGNDRDACFLDVLDYRFYLRCLAESSKLYACDVHAFVLMTNHVHLLVTPKASDGNSKLMQSIGRRYVRRFNLRHGRSGTLWEGRFKSSLVDSDEYLLACYRYIELNPVRARLVNEPEDYPWSSYLVHVGDRRSSLIRDHQTFLGLGGDVASRGRAYKELFDEPLSRDDVNEIRDSVRSSSPYGSRRFVSRMSARKSNGVRPHLT